MFYTKILRATNLLYRRIFISLVIFFVTSAAPYVFDVNRIIILGPKLSQIGMTDHFCYKPLATIFILYQGPTAITHKMNTTISTRKIILQNIDPIMLLQMTSGGRYRNGIDRPWKVPDKSIFNGSQNW